MIFVESMKKEALKRRDIAGAVVLRVVCGWEFGLSCNENRWHFSAKLFPQGRGSTEKDWHYLGRVLAEVGAPEQPLTPFETTDPNAVHHWDWSAK